jgi:hypothetical protein
MLFSSDLNAESILEPIPQISSPSFFEHHKGKLVTGVALLALSLLLVGGVLVYFNVNTLAGWILMGGGWVIGVADIIAGVVMFRHQTSNDISSNGRSPTVSTTKPLEVQHITRMEGAKLILSKALDVDVSLITISILEEAEQQSLEDKITIIIDNATDMIRDKYNQDDYDIHIELAERVHKVLGIKPDLGNVTFKIGEKTLYEAVRDCNFKKFSQERLNRLQGNQEQQLDIKGHQIKYDKTQIKTYGDLCFLIKWKTGKYYFQLSDRWYDNFPVINYDHDYQKVTFSDGTDITDQDLPEEFFNKSFVLGHKVKYGKVRFW